MKQGSKDTVVIQLILIIFGGILGMIFFGAGMYLGKSFTTMLIIFNILVVIGAVLLLQWRYKIQISNLLGELNKNIQKVLQAEEPITIDTLEYKELRGLYESIESIRANMRQQNRTKDITLKVANTLAVNIELEKLLDDLLPKVIEGTKSNWGAFYIVNEITHKLEIKASLGFSKNVYKEFDINVGEGFIGEAARNKKIKVIKDIPDDTVYITRTFIGKIKPKNMMTVPIMTQGKLNGILVLASIYEYTEEQIEVIKVIRYYLGMAVSNGITYERTQRLSTELQFQNQLIQNMNDDLEDKVKERTDFLNNIINSIKDYAIISMDENGFITTWNKGAEVLKGYGAEEVLGKHISFIYPEKDVISNKVSKELEIAEKEGEYIEYGWRTKKDGEKFFADVIITPMYNKNNELIGFTNITKDITVIKNMEQALLHEKTFNKKLLESSTRALGLIDRNGIIQDLSPQLIELLGYEKDELVGTCILDYFEDEETVEKKLREVIRRGNRAEWITKVIDKFQREHPIIINANVISDHTGRVQEIILYLKKN